MKKHRLFRPLGLILALCVTLSLAPATGDSFPLTRLEDDFYAAINADWLASATIPADKYIVGGFSDLQVEVEERLMADFAAMSEETAAQFEALPEFLRFYAMTADYATRDAQGALPLAPYLAEIDALESLADLNALLASCILRGIPAPLTVGVAADMGDARRYALYVASPSLFLPDVSYYDTPTGDDLLQTFQQVLGALLQQCGYDEAKAAEIVERALAFDALIRPYALSAEEASDYTKQYNPTAVSDFAGYSSALDLAGLVAALTPDVPELVVLTNPKYFEVLDQVVNEDTFPLLKGWMTATMAYWYSSMLSQDIAATAAVYEMAMTGQQEMDDPQKLAYRLAYSTFSGPVGVYYGRTYFGEDAKRDVTAMVTQMLQVYRNRLQANDWLSGETVEMALRKLDRMSLQIGYPDKLQPTYALFTVVPTEEGGTVMGNVMEFTRLASEANFAKCGQETDPSYWGLGADTVTAFYSTTDNCVTFPAAILQAPFYSLDQSASRNLGGIGAVIAHEITHAFDTNGSKFDEFGSLNNWWSEADYAAFEEKTEAMIALFDGLPFANGQVNGKQTVSENIADAGGLRCALEICQSLPEPDVRAFFENWATIWRMNALPEMEEWLLAVDVHAPNKLRTNVQLSNLDAFYAAFGIEESDGMYLPEEKRAEIW